jgi:putative DNA primase/helicase
VTRRQRTGGGGEHHIFRLPDGVDIGNGKLSWRPGVDLLVGSRQFVIAPSVHVTGKRYEWENPDQPVIDFPQELLELYLSDRESSSNGSLPRVAASTSLASSQGFLRESGTTRSSGSAAGCGDSTATTGVRDRQRDHGQRAMRSTDV